MSDIEFAIQKQPADETGSTESCILPLPFATERWGRRLLDLCEAGELEGIRALPNLHSLMNFVDETDNPRGRYDALIVACEKRHAHVAEFLLARGASYSYVTPQGNHALLLAARSGDVKCVNLLIDHGATEMVNVANGLSISPLTTVVHNARSYPDADQRLQTVTALLAAGADPNCRDPYGKTPLMLAAERSRVDIAAALLHAGALVDQFNSRWGAIRDRCSSAMLELLGSAAERQRASIANTMSPQERQRREELVILLDELSIDRV